MGHAKGQGAATRRRLRLDKDLEIVAERRHDLSGARLILAREKAAPGEAFVTAWVAPWQRTIRDYVRHGSEAGATADFDRKKEIEPPVTPALTRDWQQGAVYDWENRTINRHDSALSPEHMDKIAAKVAEEFNLAAAPTVDARSKRLQWLADYDDDKHHIRVHNGQWRLSYVLHELAHAVDSKVNGNKWADHGPSFVRTLLMIVERYKYWHDADDLEKSAEEDGIMIAPAEALPKLPQNPPII